MRINCPLLLLLLLILSSLVSFSSAAAYAAVNDRDNVVRLKYRFAFENNIDNFKKRPNNDDVKSLICQTNSFLTTEIQRISNNTALQVEATEIDWSYDEYTYVTEDNTTVEMPVSLSFTLNVSTSSDDDDDGSTTTIASSSPFITNNEKLDDALVDIDYNTYLTNYVWKTIPLEQNFFYRTRGLTWESDIVPPIKGPWSKVDCSNGGPGQQQQSYLTGMFSS